MSKLSNRSDSQSVFPSFLERQLHPLIHPFYSTNTSDPDANRSTQSTRLAWIKKLWNAIILALEPRHELTFCEQRDRHGNTWWEGYDPFSDRTLYFDSEDEARGWLEQRSHSR